MIHNWGLLLLGAVQIGTGLMVYSKKTELFSARPFPDSLSAYRYMLTALWLSIGVFYLAGAFYSLIEPGAVLLGLLNAALESIGYWTSARSRLIPVSYAALATLTMGTAVLISTLSFIR